MKTIRALEVIPVHVLHRPRLAQAAVISAACAALAVVLTLLLASTLNNLGSTSRFASPAATPTSVRSVSAQPGWNLSPLTSLLRSRVIVPWLAGS